MYLLQLSLSAFDPVLIVIFFLQKELSASRTSAHRSTAQILPLQLGSPEWLRRMNVGMDFENEVLSSLVVPSGTEKFCREDQIPSIESEAPLIG